MIVCLENITEWRTDDKKCKVNINQNILEARPNEAMATPEGTANIFNPRRIS